MSIDPRRMSIPAGSVSPRPERDDDQVFLAALFAANHSAVLHDAGLPPAMVDHMIALQHRSQTETYRAMFPDARFLILTLGGAPIGRLVTDDDGETIYIVDIALTPEAQGRRIGGTVIRAVMDEAARDGRDVRVQVVVTNQRSRAMFRRLGFAQRDGDDDAAQVELRWAAPIVAGVRTA